MIIYLKITKRFPAPPSSHLCEFVLSLGHVKLGHIGLIRDPYLLPAFEKCLGSSWNFQQEQSPGHGRQSHRQIETGACEF